MTTRRGFLGALAGLFAVPSLVKAAGRERPKVVAPEDWMLGDIVGRIADMALVVSMIRRRPDGLVREFAIDWYSNGQSVYTSRVAIAGR